MPSFTEKLEFSDISKLLEAVSTSKIAKKRNEFVSGYFEKLREYRAKFISEHQQAVRNLRFVEIRGMTCSDVVGVVIVTSSSIDSGPRRKGKKLRSSREITASGEKSCLLIVTSNVKMLIGAYNNESI